MYHQRKNEYTGWKDPVLIKKLKSAKGRIWVLRKKKENIKKVSNVLKGRKSFKYQSWRRKVFRLAKYKCFYCGSGGNLHAHHIKEWHFFPRLRFDVNNGMAVCVDCHKRLHPFMEKYENEQRNKEAVKDSPAKVQVGKWAEARKSGKGNGRQWVSCA